MKKRFNNIFKKGSIKAFILSCLISGSCFGILIGGFYLQYNNMQKSAQNNTQSVPYYTVPQNKGIMVNIGKDKTLFYLNFQEASIYILYADDYSDEQIEQYGYSVDYHLVGSFELIAGIVDILGGIQAEYNGENLSCTGEQICELLSYTDRYQALRREITEKIIDKISKNSFQLEDFLYIIEVSETDVSFPDCYLWKDYLEKICSNAVIIN